MSNLFMFAIKLGATIVLLNHLEYTTQYDHVSVMVEESCAVGAANAESFERYCLYKDVTRKGSLLPPAIEIQTTNMVISPTAPSRIMTASNQSGFTWRSALIFGVIASIWLPSILKTISQLIAGPNLRHGDINGQ